MNAKMSNVLWSGGGNMKPCFQLLTFKLNKYREYRFSNGN
jgi:hypothetical protein